MEVSWFSFRFYFHFISLAMFRFTSHRLNVIVFDREFHFRLTAPRRNGWMAWKKWREKNNMKRTKTDRWMVIVVVIIIYTQNYHMRQLRATTVCTVQWIWRNMKLRPTIVLLWRPFSCPILFDVHRTHRRSFISDTFRFDVERYLNTFVVHREIVLLPAGHCESRCLFSSLIQLQITWIDGCAQQSTRSHNESRYLRIFPYTRTRLVNPMVTLAQLMAVHSIAVSSKAISHSDRVRIPIAFAFVH